MRKTCKLNEKRVASAGGLRKIPRWTARSRRRDPKKKTRSAAEPAPGTWAVYLIYITASSMFSFCERRPPLKRIF